MALNDLRFAVPRRAPWGSGVFFVVAVGLVALGLVTGESGPAIGAILPAMIAAALLISRPAEIEGSVTDEGIELERPPMLVPFDLIRRVEPPVDPARPPPPSFPIRVHHHRGLLVIPEAPDINSAAIHKALAQRFSPTGSRAVHADLAGYVARHEANFGPERVWTFRAIPQDWVRDVHRPRRGMAVGLAILATSIAWFVVAAAKGKAEPNNPWWPLGGFALIIGLFTAAIGWAARHPSRIVGIKNWKASSLVIAPVGLALIQGDVQGELFWDQLRDVKFREKGGSFRLSNDSSLYGIILVVEGARIVIPDIYDRPLTLIHERILRYWKPERLEMPAEP